MQVLSRAVLFLCVAGALSEATARPVVIEESATLVDPDPVAYLRFGGEVATNGEYALVLDTSFGSKRRIRNCVPT